MKTPSSGSGRTAHRSDLEILEAIKLLRERHPGEPVTGYRLRTHFGEGHVNTYKAAIERLTLGGALKEDDESDPALDLIMEDAKKLVATLRRTASAGYSEKVEHLTAQHAQQVTQLQALVDQQKQASRELTLQLQQQETQTTTQSARMAEMTAEIAALKSRLEDQRQANQSLMVTNERLKHSVETLTERTAHYERELTTMQELEAESIKILKEGYERQLADLRADADRLGRELTTGREVRERLSTEAARTLEAKKQLEKEVHTLKLELQGHHVLIQRLDELQAVNRQLSEQVVEAKAAATTWREALTASRTGAGCHVIYADGNALIIYDAPNVWFCVAGTADAYDNLDISQVIPLQQSYLFPGSEVMLSRDQFTRVEPQDWIMMLSGEQHE